MKENQEEIFFRCPRCDNKDNFPTELDSVICAKCGAKLQVREMLCLIKRKHLTPRFGEQARWEETWLRSKNVFAFDMTPLSEPVDDEEQATREENMVCPICKQEVKVKAQPAYQLSDKARKKTRRKGWLVIGINTVIFAILLIPDIIKSTFESSDFWGVFIWGVITIVGIYILNKATPGKVFPSFLQVSEYDKRHALIKPGEKLQQTQ